MSMLHSGHLAVILSTILQWFIGVIWYSPALFGRAWHAAIDNRTGTKKPNEIAGMFAIGIGNLIVSFMVLYFLSMTGVAGLKYGAIIGFRMWLGFLAAPLFAQYIYERRPFKLFVINSGYWLVALMVSGALLGRLR